MCQGYLRLSQADLPHDVGRILSVGVGTVLVG